MGIHAQTGKKTEHGQKLRKFFHKMFCNLGVFRIKKNRPKVQKTFLTSDGSKQDL
jgi:hypothetical protein